MIYTSGITLPALYQFSDFMNLKKNKRQLVWGLNLLASMMYGSFAHAQSISFQDAERQLLQNSYSSQAYQSLEQASKLKLKQ